MVCKFRLRKSSKKHENYRYKPCQFSQSVVRIEHVGFSQEIRLQTLFQLFALNMLIRAKKFNNNQGSEGEHVGFSREVRLQTL